MMLGMDDYLDLKESGVVEAGFDGKDYRLRRPKFEEYRTFREGLVSMAELNDSAQKATDPEEKRKLNREGEDLIRDWYGQVFKTLTGEEVEMPIWVLDADLMADLLRHWRTRPLARGAKDPAKATPSTE